MRPEKGTCTGCDSEEVWIVNRTRKLCQPCNFKRTHNGQSMEEVQAAKTKEYAKRQLEKAAAKRAAEAPAERTFWVSKKPPKPLKKTRVKAKSTRQAHIEREYRKTQEHIVRTRDLKCTGCGRWQAGEVRLSFSHIISRDECHDAGMEEWIWDEENITYHCVDFGNHKGCHGKWESNGERRSLLDYRVNSAFVAHRHPDLHRRMLMNEEKALKDGK